MAVKLSPAQHRALAYLHVHGTFEVTLFGDKLRTKLPDGVPTRQPFNRLVTLKMVRYGGSGRGPFSYRYTITELGRQALDEHLRQGRTDAPAPTL